MEQRTTTRRRRRRNAGEIRLYLCLFYLFVYVLVIMLGGDVVRKSVTLEAGQALTLDLFLTKPMEDAAFTSDVSAVNTGEVGKYEVEITAGHKTYRSRVTVRDTVAPVAEDGHIMTNLNVLPDPMDCLTGIQDATTLTAAFRTEPKVDALGETTAAVRLTDGGGNKADIPVTVQVVDDKEAPVLEGVRDLEAFVGDTVRYKEGVTLADNIDPDPVLEIDNSGVNLNAEGSYPVIYRARDRFGNTTSQTVTLTVSVKPEGYVEPEEVYAMAKEVLGEITDSSMDSMQVAYAVYRWTKYNIGYTGTSDKSSWTRGAYDGFTNRAGDCFTYYAVSKALLDVAGIDNVDIVKSDTSHSSHYWLLINLGDGWYHFDATPRTGKGDNFFMLTDEELDSYSRKHDNSHIFDPSLYPERATESVQDMVNYSSATLER